MLRERLIRIILISIILICSVLIVLEEGIIHGQAVGVVDSNVSVFLSLAIDFSPALQNGVVYDEVLVLPVNNLNATRNYNGSLNSSEYYVSISSDGNTPVDLCMRVASPLMTSGGDIIGYDNQSYSFDFVNNATYPLMSSEVPFSLSYEKAGNNIPIGSNGYLRFFLDVPIGQAPGDYNNSVEFRGVASGLGC